MSVIGKLSIPPNFQKLSNDGKNIKHWIKDLKSSLILQGFSEQIGYMVENRLPSHHPLSINFNYIAEEDEPFKVLKETSMKMVVPAGDEGPVKGYTGRVKVGERDTSQPLPLTPAKTRSNGLATPTPKKNKKKKDKTVSYDDEEVVDSSVSTPLATVIPSSERYGMYPGDEHGFEPPRIEKDAYSSVVTGVRNFKLMCISLATCSHSLCDAALSERAENSAVFRLARDTGRVDVVWLILTNLTNSGGLGAVRISEMNINVYGEMLNVFTYELDGNKILLSLNEFHSKVENLRILGWDSQRSPKISCTLGMALIRGVVKIKKYAEKIKKADEDGLLCFPYCTVENIDQLIRKWDDEVNVFSRNIANLDNISSSTNVTVKKTEVNSNKNNNSNKSNNSNNTNSNNNNNNNKKSNNNNKFEVKCDHCKKSGHHANLCPTAPDDVKELYNTIWEKKKSQKFPAKKNNSKDK